MALTIDAQSNSGNQVDPPASTLTWSHTCASSARLYVGVFDCNAGAASRITGVTYNGVALTKAVVSLTGNAGDAEIWYIDAPSSGANNIVATASTSARMVGGATSFLGAATASLGATNSANSATAAVSSISVALTTTAANSYIFAVANVNNTNTISATGTNQTKNFTVLNTSDGDGGAGSTQTTTTAGSYTNSFSYATASTAAIAVAEIKPAVAVANGNLLTFF